MTFSSPASAPLSMERLIFVNIGKELRAPQEYLSWKNELNYCERF